MDKVVYKFIKIYSNARLIIRKEKEIKGLRNSKIENCPPTHGRVEFLVQNTTDQVKILFIIEVKINEVNREIQLILALRDAYDLNKDGQSVYGAVTTVFNWIFIIYDGLSFKVSNQIQIE